MRRRRFSLASAILSFAIAAGAMSAATFSGCYRPEDTLINITDVAASSGSGGGGEGGGGPLSARQYFEMNVKEPMLNTCGTGECHGGVEKAFIQKGQEYAFVTTYETALGIPLLVDPPQLSPLITRPDAAGHDWRTWAGLPELRGHTLRWLELEAENLEPLVLLQVGPIVPQGFTVLPLDSISPDFVGSSLSFYAQVYGDPATVLELTDIAIWPPNGRGLRVTNPTFFTIPSSGSAIANTSFHGDPTTHVAPGNVTLGAGDLVLTEWGEKAQLVVTFDAMKLLYADDTGATFDPCTRPQLFRTAVDSLPVKSSLTQVNGMQYCAEQCHGGVKGSAPTNKMDLRGLLSDPRDYGLACAKARVFVTPTNVDDSLISTVTDPDGGGFHPFSFGGNVSSHNAFKAAMKEWVDAEGAVEE